jgi:hypothetical protein
MVSLLGEITPNEAIQIPQGSDFDRLHEQIEQLFAIVSLLKQIFREHEDRIKPMKDPINSQHAAIMKLSEKAPPSPLFQVL